MNQRIDAHHHVWDLAVRAQPWMVGAEMAPIRRSFGIDEFASQALANDVAASVVVQTVADIGETEELLDLADVNRVVAGVVGWVDVAAPDVGDQLDRLQARPTGRWLVGLRSLVQYEPDPAWLSRSTVLAGMREVARRGLCNELLVLPHQLDAVLGVVDAIPESRFVLDHLGKPGIGSGAFQPWARQLSAVAQHANVSAKISGLVTEATWSSWTETDLRPYVEHALLVFGPGRLIFGSDWPVCTLAASYQRIVELAEQLLGGLSVDEQAAVMGGTTAEVYSLEQSRPEEP